MGALGYLAASTPPRLASAGSAVAIPILAVQQLGSIGIGGALVAVSLGPSILAAPLVGAVLDRTRRPGRLIALAGLLTATAFFVAGFLDRVPLPLEFASLAVAGAVAPFYMGGLSSFVANAIPDQRRSFAYDALSYNLSAVAGPALVAAMAALLPAQAAMFVLSAAALLGSVCVAAIRLPAHGASERSVWSTTLAGLRHIFGHRPLAVVTVSSSLTQLGQGGLAVAAVALSIDRIGSPADAALLVTAFAAGSLLGAVVETARPTRARPHVVMGVGFLATGVFTIAAVANLGMVWTVVAIGLSGAFTASTSAAMLLLRNALSPAHLRAQIFTVGAGLRASASAAGAALAGSATGLGGAVAVAAIGVVWIVSAALMAAYPSDAPVTQEIH
jgi:hypothetical protein